MHIAYELARIAINDVNEMAKDMLGDDMYDEAIALLTNHEQMASQARDMLVNELQEEFGVNEQTANEICDQMAAQLLEQCGERARANILKMVTTFNK